MHFLETFHTNSSTVSFRKSTKNFPKDFLKSFSRKYSNDSSTNKFKFFFLQIYQKFIFKLIFPQRYKVKHTWPNTNYTITITITNFRNSSKKISWDFFKSCWEITQKILLWTFLDVPSDIPKKANLVDISLQFDTGIRPKIVAGNPLDISAGVQSKIPSEIPAVDLSSANQIFFISEILVGITSAVPTGILYSIYPGIKNYYLAFFHKFLFKIIKKFHTSSKDCFINPFCLGFFQYFFPIILWGISWDSPRI